jgi:hypothetical protein
MTVPFTGALVLILGILFFLSSPRLLYAALIVSIPFSGMAVLNDNSGDVGRGLAVWLFLSALWVLREAISSVPPWHKRGWFASRRARYGLLAFLGAVVASLSVPLLLNGTAWVPVLDAGYLVVIPSPIRFGTYSLTRTTYVAVGVMLAVLIAAENCSPTRLYYTLKLYVGSCIFAAVWGLFQFWCNLTGHKYPAFLFNNSASLSALNYGETLAQSGLNLHRVASVAFEPSVLAEELLLALVVLFVCRGLRRPLLSRRWDFAAVVLMGAAVLVTTSTTAYVGMLIVLLIAGVALFRAGEPSKFYFVSVGAAVAAGVIVVVAVPLVGKLASVVLVNKLQTGSGAGRLESVVIAAHDFLRYPLLGAGWNRVYSSDLVFLLLANTGLVGFIAFLSFMYPTLRDLWACAGQGFRPAVVLLAATALALALAEGTMLEYTAGYDWLFFGLAVAAVAAARGGTLSGHKAPADFRGRVPVRVPARQRT